MSEIMPVLGDSGLRRWLYKARFTSVLWLMMLPSFVGLVAFTYYPNFESITYAFYKWDGAMVEEYRGTENFREALLGGDPKFWGTFGLILILLAANLLKMWPSIFAAIVLHRLKNAKAQYLYRVLFVIPMVIPALVGLLLWKSFFDANVGIFNGFLRVTGLMDVLAWLDHAWPALTTVVNQDVLAWNASGNLFVNLLTLPFKAIPFAFGSVLGVALFGIFVLVLGRGFRPFVKFWILWPILAGLSIVVCSDFTVASSGLGLLRATALVAAAWWIGRLMHARDTYEAPNRLRWIGWGAIALGLVLAAVSLLWTQPTSAFVYGRPAWLGHSQLIVPAVILWGFPWIGTVGVLIYLAGLSNISQEVYEAAELDGVGFWGKIFKIEVPLIMSQVRINLIFLTIGTLNEYGFFLILLGPSGGPGGAGLTPGLYMYQQAFVNGRLGYACALGMMMFLIILYLTVINQRHVKVDK